MSSCDPRNKTSIDACTDIEYGNMAKVVHILRNIKYNILMHTKSHSTLMLRSLQPYLAVGNEKVNLRKLGWMVDYVNVDKKNCVHLKKPL